MAWPGEEDQQSEEAELALDNGSGLPWLESGEEDYEEGAVDTSKIIGFALIVLTILGVGIGGDGGSYLGKGRRRNQNRHRQMGRSGVH